MSEFTDNIKAIEASLELRDQCIHEQHERIVRLEEEVRTGAILVAKVGDRNRELETELRITQQALARATKSDVVA